MVNDNEWIFTFGSGQPLEGYCVRLDGDYGEARRKMFEKFGENWAFQYSAKNWDEWKKDPNRAWVMEKELEINDAEAWGHIREVREVLERWC